MADRTDVAVKRIVVGVDGSPESKAALRWAARIAPTIGCSIDAIMAWDYPASYGWVMAPDGWPIEEDSAATLQSIIDEVFGELRPVNLRAVCQQGAARTVLLDTSKDAEMLIVGSRGHGGFSGLLLGSVSAACAEHAHCPVLVVHGEPCPNTKESAA
ncbi:MAG TPA: universal stress protein [Acidothermaceae bacterium]|jgi:nucleotide-binding universal stress UspA family protein